jgi:malate dehydrogenase
MTKAISEDGKTPIKVCVAGGDGEIGYILGFMIGQGSLLGPEQQIALSLVGANKFGDWLEMELRDAGLAKLGSVERSVDLGVGFSGCQ